MLASGELRMSSGVWYVHRTFVWVLFRRRTRESVSQQYSMKINGQWECGALSATKTKARTRGRKTAPVTRLVRKLESTIDKIKYATKL